MSTAATVLNIIQERGKRKLPLEDIYRQLYNPDLYLRAYAKLYPNKGAMTQGSTSETVDAMRLSKNHQIIDDLRCERYRWTPVRRVYISEHSHGFRPGRGCHTALATVKHTWNGTRWFIEGDIQACFDRIDHEVLLSILGEKLHDQRFLRLIRHLLRAGYLDAFVEQTLLPTYNQEETRRMNPPYRVIYKRMYRRRKAGKPREARALEKQLRTLPVGDPADPSYRRLRYIRYADDTLFGFAGPKAQAEDIKRQLKEFLQASLKLELSEEKTLITHANTEAARFLGLEIQSDVQWRTTRLN